MVERIHRTERCTGRVALRSLFDATARVVIVTGGTRGIGRPLADGGMVPG